MRSYLSFVRRSCHSIHSFSYISQFLSIFLRRLLVLWRNSIEKLFIAHRGVCARRACMCGDSAVTPEAWPRCAQVDGRHNESDECEWSERISWEKDPLVRINKNDLGHTICEHAHHNVRLFGVLSTHLRVVRLPRFINVPLLCYGCCCYCYCKRYLFVYIGDAWTSVVALQTRSVVHFAYLRNIAAHTNASLNGVTFYLKSLLMDLCAILSHTWLLSTVSVDEREKSCSIIFYRIVVCVCGA